MTATVTIDDPPCRSVDPRLGLQCTSAANHDAEEATRIGARPRIHRYRSPDGAWGIWWTDLAGDDLPPFQPDERLLP